MPACEGAMKAWPFNADDPPSMLPCGSLIVRPLRPGCTGEMSAKRLRAALGNAPIYLENGIQLPVDFRTHHAGP